MKKEIEREQKMRRRAGIQERRTNRESDIKRERETESETERKREREREREGNRERRIFESN